MLGPGAGRRAGGAGRCAGGGARCRGRGAVPGAGSTRSGSQSEGAKRWAALLRDCGRKEFAETLEIKSIRME